jgi:hypothetical protein
MKMYTIPWLHYNLYEDGTGTIKRWFCMKKKYSLEQMDKLWEKWYINFINPYKVHALSKISLFDANIEHLPDLKTIKNNIKD